MKRFFLSALLLLAALLPVFSQMKVSVETPDLDVQVKRAFAQGDNVCIDLMITNQGNYESIYFDFWATKIYDDEGNEYTGNALSKDGPGTFGGKIDIPRDIPRKVRIIVHNVDEYASAFTLTKFVYEVYNPRSSGSKSLTIKNLPITK